MGKKAKKTTKKDVNLVEVAKTILQEEVELQQLIGRVCRRPAMPRKKMKLSHEYDEPNYEKQSKPQKIDERKFLKQAGSDEFSTFRLYYEQILNNGYLLEIIEEVKAMKEKGSCVMVSVESINESYNYVGRKIARKHKELLFASERIDKKWTRRKGNHLIANSNIGKFDVVVREPSYLLQVIPNCSCSLPKVVPAPVTRCHNCSKIVANFLTCDYCNLVVFCSAECRVRAHNLFHKYECFGLQKHFWPRELHDHSLIAMRMMLNGVPYFHKDLQTDDCPDASAEFGYNYRDMYDLVSNFRKIPIGHVNEMLYKVTRNLVYLIEGTFFFHQWPEKMYEMYLYVGGLMLRHYCQAQCNAVYIEYTNLDLSVGLDVTSGYAKAICPTIACFNHSCKPNCFIINYYNAVVVKALCKIEKGDELTLCYFEICPTLPFHQRAEIFAAFHYGECPCERCERDSQACAPYLCVHCNSSDILLNGAIGDLWTGICRNCDNLLDVTSYHAIYLDIQKTKQKFEKSHKLKYLERIAVMANKIYDKRSSSLLNEYKYIATTYQSIPFNTIHVKYGMKIFSNLDEIMPITEKHYLLEKLNFLKEMTIRPEILMAECLSMESCEIINEWSQLLEKTDRILRQLLPPWKSFFDEIKEKSTYVITNLKYRGFAYPDRL